MYNGTYRTIIENSGTFHFLTGTYGTDCQKQNQNLKHTI